MGIVARCCDAIVMSEQGRLGLSGPEVIETVAGVEEFDARDRALVWRTLGGKHRYLQGECQRLVPDDMQAFRHAVTELLDVVRPLSLEGLEAQHRHLAGRVAEYGDCADAMDIWRRMGIESPESLALLEEAEFLAQADATRQRRAP